MTLEAGRKIIIKTELCENYSYNFTTIQLTGIFIVALEFPVGPKESVTPAHLASSKSCNSHMFYTELNLTLFPCFSIHIAVYQYNSVKQTLNVVQSTS